MSLIGNMAHEADALRRELADAKAEVERLRKLFDDAGQGEHNVLALVDHYIAETERLRAMCDDSDDKLTAVRVALSDAGIPAMEPSTGEPLGGVDRIERLQRQRDEAGAELSELRAVLAAAAKASSPQRGEVLEGYSLRCVQRYPDGGYRAVFDHPSEEPVGLPLFGGASLGRSTFDAMAERAGPLPTAVLAQTEPPVYGPTTTAHEVTLRTEPPIESLGRMRVPAEVHERGWQWRPTSDDTAFAPPFSDLSCRVCGCGGLCDPGVYCPQARRPSDEERGPRCGKCPHRAHQHSVCKARSGGTAYACACTGGGVGS